MQDFISDDHDHSHSVTSLSVQLFTVPTLAQFLMGHHDALAALLRCFLVEIERRKNFGKKIETPRSDQIVQCVVVSDGRLSFDRSQNQQSFRRAMYVLYDIKYLLSAVPLPEVVEGAITNFPSADEDPTSGRWNEPLRKGFLHGFEKLLSLLACMEVIVLPSLLYDCCFHGSTSFRGWTALLVKLDSTSSSKLSGRQLLICTVNWRPF